MRPHAFLAPALLALAPLVNAQERRGPDEATCRNVNFPSSEQLLIRACHAQFNLCANPPPAWQRLPQVMQVCAAIQREQQLPRAATYGAPREQIANAPSVNIGAGAGAVPPAAGSLAGPWKLNGNGAVGDVLVQSNADGTLAGSLYGDALTGYYAPGERVGVWLRVQGGRPMQAYVGQASTDGAAFVGRIYTLNATNSGGSAQRNVFAFSALRGGSAPAHPGLPPATPGPANLTGTYAINGNGFPGTLQLNQAADGTLSGSVYGQPIEGHYAAGSGTIAFIRYAAPGQPLQLFVGSVTAQGVQNGELFALSANGGASAQRMRFGWTLQTTSATSAPAQPAQNQLDRGGMVRVSPGVAPQGPRFIGWDLAVDAGSQRMTSGSMSSISRCGGGKVVSGAALGGNGNADSRVIASAPQPDGSGWITTVAARSTGALAPAYAATAACIDRPDGYQIVAADGSLLVGNHASVTATCPAGKLLIGGGARADVDTVQMVSNGPRSNVEAWSASFHYESAPPPPSLTGHPATGIGSPRQLVAPAALLRVYAICVDGRYAAALRVRSAQATLEAAAVVRLGSAKAGARAISTNSGLLECGPGVVLGAGFDVQLPIDGGRVDTRYALQAPPGPPPTPVDTSAALSDLADLARDVEKEASRTASRSQPQPHRPAAPPSSIPVTPVPLAPPPGPLTRSNDLVVPPPRPAEPAVGSAARTPAGPAEPRDRVQWYAASNGAAAAITVRAVCGAL